MLGSWFFIIWGHWMFKYLFGGFAIFNCILLSGFYISSEVILSGRCVRNDWLQVDIFQSNWWLWPRESVENSETTCSTKKEKSNHFSCGGMCTYVHHVSYNYWSFVISLNFEYFLIPAFEEMNFNSGDNFNHLIAAFTAFSYFLICMQILIRSSIWELC